MHRPRQTVGRARSPGVRLTRRSLPDDGGDQSRRGGSARPTPTTTALDLARIRPARRGRRRPRSVPRAVDVVFLEPRCAARRRPALTGRDCRHVRPGRRARRRAGGLPAGDAAAAAPPRVRRCPGRVAQFSVRDGERLRSRGCDFAWPEHRLAVGVRGRLARRAPAGREATGGGSTPLTRAGWRVIFVTAADLHDPVRLCSPGSAELSGAEIA